ncbi:unnamed protein product, partial [Symbiodinium microadriaticum]
MLGITLKRHEHHLRKHRMQREEISRWEAIASIKQAVLYLGPIGLRIRTGCLRESFGIMLGALAIFALIPLAALGVKALQQLNERCASSTPAGSKDEMETSWKDLE